MLVVPDDSEILLLKYMLNHTSPTDVKLKLFSNNQTPAEADVLADYTESTAAGYASKTLTGSSWSVANSSGVTTATYAQQTFTFTTAATIYGYYVTNNGATSLLWAERFTGAPVSIPSSGGVLNVTPTFTGE